jgi:DNA-binding transcriptional ArsR family regulator
LNGQSQFEFLLPDMKKKLSGSDKFLKTKKFLKTVAEENRLKILFELKNKTMNVTELHTKLRLPQNLTSHHISKLKKVGLLSEKHDGTFRLYSANKKKLAEFTRIFRELLGV